MTRNFAAPELNLGVGAADFLQKYWQKQPKLMRQALRNFVCPMSANDLAGLACLEGSLARIVQGTGKRFSVESGPFADARFAHLGSSNWTLLVQEVDQWDRNVRDLLRHFDFLPRWRIEDVMVSYAVRGGSVGAHVDQYDVFLLQARGQRRWQIDDRPEAKAPERQRFLPKAKLKLLAEFEPNQDWVLSPGDMLYLPPGVPHHGVALDDDCMTFSIGLRAPSATEMFEHFARTEAQLFPDSLRYSDPTLKPKPDSAALDQASVQRVRETLAQAMQLSDCQLGAWFANFMSAYRANTIPEITPPAIAGQTLLLRPNQSDIKALAKLEQRLSAGAKLTLAPGIRVIEWQGVLYMGGRKISCDQRMLKALSAFYVQIDAAIWRHLTLDAKLWTLKLKRTNALIFERRTQQDL